MLPIPQVEPKAVEVSSSRTSAGPCENTLENHDEDRTLNIKKGIIRTRANPAKTSYTILLVGETGVGKSSFLELIANVLHGKDINHYDLDALDRTNEQSGSKDKSQTNSVRLYQFTSTNGVVVRIVDTPGLADTRSVQHAGSLKKSITDQINNHIDPNTAALVLINGTIPHVTAGTDYALSILSAIFPKTPAHNIALMFTNVLSPLHWNFDDATIPDVLKEAPQFFLNNPIALRRKYNKLKDDPNTRKVREELYEAVKAGEQDAMEMLVDLFDWLSDLEPQLTMGSVPLYDEGKESHGIEREPEAKSLENGHNVTEELKSDQRQPKRIRSRLRHIEKGLELLRKARNIVREGVQRSKQILIRQ